VVDSQLNVSRSLATLFLFWRPEGEGSDLHFTMQRGVTDTAVAVVVVVVIVIVIVIVFASWWAEVIGRSSR
jgi:hypothetical protein